MISIVKRPPGLILSGSQAWFQVSGTAPNKELSCTIKDFSGQEIATLNSYASAGGIAFFEISEVLRPLVKPQYSFIGQQDDIIQHITSEVIKSFVITFSDKQHNQMDALLSVLYGEITPDFIAMANYGTSPHTTVSDYLALNPFLTLKTHRVSVHYGQQPESLYFLAPESLSGLSINLGITYGNGGTIYINVASFNATAVNIYKINTSFDTLVKPHIPGDKPTPQVCAYSVRLFHGIQQLGRTFFYDVNFRNDAPGSFVFVNSLGGMDTFCPTGVRKTSFDSKATLKQRLVTPGKADHLYRLTGSSFSQSYTQNTGHLDEATLNWLSQMIYSKKAFWMPRDAQAIPISFMDNKIQHKSIKPKLYSADIKYIINPILEPESSAL